MLNVQELKLGTEPLTALAGYLQEKFAMVLKARLTQIDDKAANWQRNYDALPAQTTRTTPFYRASNFMPHLIRMHSDILAARTTGILFGTRPFWRVKTLMDNMLPHEVLNALSKGMNFLWENEIDGFETTDQVVHQSLQTGTLVLKGLWSDSTSSYMGTDGSFLERDDTGMQYDPVPFEDFWPFPITARDVRRAEILFHRIRLTQRDVDDRVKDNRWDETAGKMLMKDSSIEPVKAVEAQSSGINLTKDVDYPFSAIEAWLTWDVGGKRRPIVVVFNPTIAGPTSILRAYYNFYPYGRNPFIDFRPMPRKGSFYGYAVPEILEQSQEEQAQIHNQRRDANTIANIPSWKKLRNADVPNPATDWYPGCIIELDDMGDLEYIGVTGNYNGMIDEEQFLLSLAERYIGISPSMQGFGAGQAAGKRGIYSTGATLALLSEGNKRIDIYIRRVRAPFHQLGSLTALSYNQFAPKFFEQFGQAGKEITDAFALANPQRGLLYALTASDAASNREIDRQSLLQMAGVMSQYYERLVEAAGACRQLEPQDPLRKIFNAVLDSAADLADRILFAFDQGDRERLLPKLRQQLGDGGQPVATKPDDASRLSSDQRTVEPSQLEDFAKNIRAVTSGAR
jgi:hypothetical protein